MSDEPCACSNPVHEDDDYFCEPAGCPEAAADAEQHENMCCDCFDGDC